MNEEVENAKDLKDGIYLTKNMNIFWKGQIGGS